MAVTDSKQPVVEKVQQLPQPPFNAKKTNSHCLNILADKMQREVVGEEVKAQQQFRELIIIGVFSIMPLFGS